MSGPYQAPRVVCDCMAFLQAAANRNSSSAGVLDLVDRREIRLFVDRTVLAELRDVLSRPKVRTRLEGINDATVTALFRRLESGAEFVREVPREVRRRRELAEAGGGTGDRRSAKGFPGPEGFSLQNVWFKRGF